MKRFVILVSVLLASLASAAWEQQTTANATPLNNKPVYYDTFNQKWLDPAKWLVGWGPECGLSLECVREIQNNKLRLAVREFGATDSDYGSPWSNVDLYFVNPNAINSITADATLRRFDAAGCSATNDAGYTHAFVGINGSYFNTGSGEYADDVTDGVVITVNLGDPTSMDLSNWMAGSGLGVSTHLGTYPIGTPLTETIAWDKANHQFISVVKVKDAPSPGIPVVIPYNVPDTAQPAYPLRSFNVNAGPSNCTSAQTFAYVEAFFENVQINVPLPPAH